MTLIHSLDSIDLDSRFRRVHPVIEAFLPEEETMDYIYEIASTISVQYDRKYFIANARAEWLDAVVSLWITDQLQSLDSPCNFDILTLASILGTDAWLALYSELIVDAREWLSRNSGEYPHSNLLIGLSEILVIE